MKALLPLGIVLILVGLAGGFAHQLIVAASTGLPTDGIGWMQASGFVLAALGAILIGIWIGRRRKARARIAAPAPRVATREVRRADADAVAPAASKPDDRRP